MNNTKLRSTTFWLAIIALLLIPISWGVEYFLKMRMLSFMVENNLTPNELKDILITIPLGPIVTLATFAISVYGARKAGREISTNLTLPQGHNTNNTTNIESGGR